jgi:hypothetical protein
VTRMIQCLAVALLVASPTALRAQDSPSPSQGSARASGPAQVPLKVTLVMSRYQGDKKVSSSPYTLMLTANDREQTRLRLGTQVPIVSTVFGVSAGAPSAGKEASATVPMQSYNYKDVGTNIDCVASSAADGAFKLNLTIADSSVYYPDRTETAVASSMTATGAPAFRSFTSTFSILLRDGQNSQFIAATDSVSGQSLRLEATLNVQK